MSIRLNQVLRQLNIGLQTAIDYLRSKKDLGDISEDANVNTKISDEQYGSLVKRFQGDKAVKEEASRMLTKKIEEKKAVKAERKAKKEAKMAETSPRQKYNPIGKIDLEGLNGSGKSHEQVIPGKDKPAEKEIPIEKKGTVEAEAKGDLPTSSEPIVSDKPVISEEPKPVEEVRKQKEEPKETKPVISEEVPEKKEEPKETVAPKVPEKPVIKAKEEKEEPEPVRKENKEEPKPTESPAPSVQSEAPAKPEEPRIYTLKSERDLAPKVNVVGKIDLDSLNQSTRPRRKTKEEIIKERMASQAGQKKKRIKITTEKVDIEAVANESRQAQGKKGKQKGQPSSSQQKQSDQDRRNGGKGSGKSFKDKRFKKVEPSEEDVARQVRETLAKLTGKGLNKKGAKYRREKRDAAHERLEEERMEEQAESKILKLTEFVTVSELASMMNVPVNKVIGTCMSIGIMVSINQRLDAETINIVAEEFGFTTEYVSSHVSEAVSEESDDENDLEPRIPIVTVMGHVDHGKTSLLDYIRKSNIIAGEAGGITQHIGAYNVTLPDGRRITFLDTPGHEAFTAMRARGAQVTDIAIIIVAADDSVMPTTKEAIAHAQAANVPMVFAINKIDKPGANPDKIREDLANMNLLVEEWGGKYQCQEISAKKGQGVQQLLEKVLLEAEMLDLKANPNRKATGSIIESKLDKGRGYMSTVLVSNGTLKVGDIVIAGTSWGRIRAMFNERNQKMDKALPAEPCVILGLNGAPSSGDAFHVMASEQEAKDIASKREQLQREQGLRTQKRLTLADLSHRIALGSFKQLNLLVKGDTDGSIEALSDSFINLSTEKIKVNVIQKAVGPISENDVELAYTAEAIIVGFQVRPSSAARKLAEKEGVEINTYSVIYDAIDDIKKAMEGMLDKIKKEVVTGQAEVREVYHISKVGSVAGAYVTEGKVHRSDKARVVRDGIVVHTGDINALKRYKDDVKEVATNFECGISLVGFNDIMSGDIIETYTVIEVEQKL